LILISHCSKWPPPGLFTRTSASSFAALLLSKQSRIGCGVVVVVDEVVVVELVVVVEPVVEQYWYCEDGPVQYWYWYPYVYPSRPRPLA
jgi:hypothetical protein